MLWLGTEDLFVVYNDAYTEILGDKLDSFARPGRESEQVGDQGCSGGDRAEHDGEAPGCGGERGHRQEATACCALPISSGVIGHRSSG